MLARLPEKRGFVGVFVLEHKSGFVRYREELMRGLRSVLKKESEACGNCACLCLRVSVCHFPNESD
jgi:hypothetical protein